jgi:proteasome assembly chaperone (PAC2) family protein
VNARDDHPAGRPEGQYRIVGPLPEVERPVLVVMLGGWIDASGSAVAAVEALADQLHARTFITFDDDAFIDYRARRPTMEVRDGLNERLVWNLPELRHGTDRAGNDVLLLTGPEPDTAWRRFATVVADLAEEFGVRAMFGLGAYPFATPHTRPSRISCTSPSVDVLATVGHAKSTVDVPAGTEALLEHTLTERGIPSLGLWVQVPHYVSAMAYPAASAALLEALAHDAGLDLDISHLRNEGVIQRQRLDTLISQNDEHATMLGQLEIAFDAIAAVTGPGADETASDLGPLPSGDDLAREVEAFLRSQGETESGS